MALLDENGERIRGREKEEAVEVAPAKEKLSWTYDSDASTIGNNQWLIARVCSDYIQYCEYVLLKGQISKNRRDNSVRWLNDLFGYCGALPAAQQLSYQTRHSLVAEELPITQP